MAGFISGAACPRSGAASPKASRPECAGRLADFRTIFRRVPVRLVAYVVSWDKCRRDRRLLANLSDRALHDLGIDRATVESDSANPFWRLR